MDNTIKNKLVLIQFTKIKCNVPVFSEFIEKTIPKFDSIALFIHFNKDTIVCDVIIFELIRLWSVEFNWFIVCFNISVPKYKRRYCLRTGANKIGDKCTFTRI